MLLAPTTGTIKQQVPTNFSSAQDSNSYKLSLTHQTTWLENINYSVNLCVQETQKSHILHTKYYRKPLSISTRVASLRYLVDLTQCWSTFIKSLNNQFLLWFSAEY